MVSYLPGGSLDLLLAREGGRGLVDLTIAKLRPGLRGRHPAPHCRHARHLLG